MFEGFLQLLLTLRNLNFKRTGHNAHLSHAPIFILAHLHTELVLAKAIWITSAVGIELRFYDDLENMLASYRINRGECTCVVDNIHDF